MRTVAYFLEAPVAWPVAVLFKWPFLQTRRARSQIQTRPHHAVAYLNKAFYDASRFGSFQTSSANKQRNASLFIILIIAFLIVLIILD